MDSTHLPACKCGMEKAMSECWLENLSLRAGPPLRSLLPKRRTNIGVHLPAELAARVHPGGSGGRGGRQHLWWGRGGGVVDDDVGLDGLDLLTPSSGCSPGCVV